MLAGLRIENRTGALREERCVLFKLEMMIFLLKTTILCLIFLLKMAVLCVLMTK